MTFDAEHSGQNPTFNGNGPTWANACVGDNGSPQIIDYAQGFAKSVNILLDQVIADRGSHFYVDELIYPICFGIRHAVELYLKSTAKQLEKLAAYRETAIQFNLDGSHHVGKIWQHIVDYSKSIDRRYDLLVVELTPYIDDLADVDATGQVFRYAFSSENKKHLTDLAVINIIVLKNRFNDLISLLKQLDQLNHRLDVEYGFGTFTKVLSRTDLLDIASMLPPRSQWREAIFDDAKAKIKAKYALNAINFTDALHLIEKHREMAQIIEAPFEFPDFPLSVVFTLLDEWVEREKKMDEKAKPPIGEILDSDGFVELMLGSIRDDADAWGKLKELLTPNVFAQIKTVYSIGYEHAPCELYPKFLETNQVVLRGSVNTEGNGFREAVMHVLRKPQLVHNVVSGLKSLGQNARALEVENRYRDWLTSASAEYH